MAIQAGDLRAAKKVTAMRLKSRTSLLAAAYRFNKAQKVEERLSTEELLEAVSQVDMFRESVEPVKLVEVRKGNGKWRETNDFGAADRIAQTLVTMCLEPFTPLYVRNYQFGQPGRGFDPAIDTVRQHMATGLVWAAELDIENCFGSANISRRLRRCCLRPGVARGESVAKWPNGQSTSYLLVLLLA